MVPLLLLAVGRAACGGGSSGGGAESSPPSLASIEKCLAAGKAEVSKGKANPDEIVGKMPDEGLIIAFTVAETFHRGRAVISLSNHPGKEDVKLAQGCI